jgi:predicted phosphoribosyltransferase
MAVIRRLHGHAERRAERSNDTCAGAFEEAPAMQPLTARGVQAMDRFHDRSDAGRRLGRLLRETVGSDALVLGLARGGVPIAYEVARSLRAALDVVVIRKLGVPGEGELAMGALGPRGTRVLNRDVVRLFHIPESVIEGVAAREQAEAERREREYRRGFPPADVAGRSVVLVDDGVATGASLRAAIAYLRGAGAARIVVAVPVGALETCEELRRDADEVVCLQTPESFFAVGQFYDDFAPVSDEEVRRLLARAAEQRRPPQRATHQ